MNEQLPPPQRQRSGGCCGMGCATALGLVIFLALASIGGVLWGVQHLRHKYSAPEPVDMPEVVTSDTPASVFKTPVESAEPAATPVPMRETETRWKSFEKAADSTGKNRIELSAGEINALLQSHKNTRGKVFVWIENNVGRVRVSIPLKGVPLMQGRFLNGEATVQASPDGDPYKAQISNIVLSDNSVPATVMDQRLFGWSSMRGVISDWIGKEGITSFRIENNRVVGEKTGGHDIR